MFYTFIMPVITLFLILLFFEIKHRKNTSLLTKIQLFKFFALLLIMESNANYSNIFVVNINQPIKYENKINEVLKQYNIPTPNFKKHRFYSANQVTIKGQDIILPVDYVKYSEAQMKYIILNYIEHNLISLEENKIIEDSRKLQAELKKTGSNKIVLISSPNHTLKLKKNNSPERISKIKAQKGEVQCSFSFSKIDYNCSFKSIEDLNLSKDSYVSSLDFLNNLENKFEIVIANESKNKIFYNNTGPSTYNLPEDLFN